MIMYDSRIVDINNPDKVIGRKFEVKDGDEWIETKIADMKCGQTFRVFNGSKLFVDEFGSSEFHSMSTPILGKIGIYKIHYR